MAPEFCRVIFGCAILLFEVFGPIWGQSDSLWLRTLDDQATDGILLSEKQAAWDTFAATDTSIETWKARQLDTISRYTGTDLFVASRILRLLLRYRKPRSPMEWKAFDFLTRQELNRLSAIDPGLIESIGALGKKRKTRMRGHTLLRWTRKWRPADQSYLLSPRSHPGSAYLGDPNHLLIQTRLQLGREWTLALCMEKDAGESIDDGLFDHWSGFIAWQPRERILERLILGSFHVQWGQGLCLWSGSRMDFRAGPDPMWNGRGVTPYSGAMEMLHLKGMASRWRWQDWRLELIAAHRYLNGSIDQESGLKVDIGGYSRTLNERARRSALSLSLFGTYLRWTKKHQRIGLIYRTQLLNGRRKVRREAEQVLAAEYLLQWKKNRIYAEGSLKSQGGAAWIIGSHLPLIPRMVFGLHLRKISKNYPSSTSRLYERSTDNGVFEQELRITAECSDRLKVDGFILHRQMLDPANLQASQQLGVRGYFNARPGLSFSFGLRQRMKGTHETNALSSSPFSLGSLFLQRDQTLNERMRLLSRIASVHSDRSLLPQGGLLFQEFVFRSRSVRASARMTGFSTPDHAHRMYTYRGDVRYGFSVPAYHGRGVEFHALIGLKKGDWLLEARFTMRKTHGLPEDTDLRMQLIRSF